MPVRVEELDGNHSPWGLRTILAENRYLKFTLFPDLGAKIYGIVHKPTGKQLLWQSPTVPPAPATPGSSFDDCWAGGWDELFPNDEPATLDGLTYPDHGELWTAKWQCDIQTRTDRLVLLLTTQCRVSGCQFEKWITLEHGEERIRFRERIVNLRPQPFHYLWKLHPALAVSPGDRILIPAGNIRREPAFPGTQDGQPLEQDGPLTCVAPPPESRELHFLYGLNLSAGWCGTYDPQHRLAVGLSFPREIFNTCWLFASYGGWRDYYVAALEPCTGYPFRVEEARARGQCAILPPLGVQEAEMVFSVRQGLAGLTGISPDGEIE